MLMRGKPPLKQARVSAYMRIAHMLVLSYLNGIPGLSSCEMVLAVQKEKDAV